VDHSIPGAYGFIIHCSEGTLVYTGDFRRHGTRPQLTQDFIDEIQQAGSPDIVLCEGTNIAKAELTKEAEVRKQIEATIEKCRGLAIVDFSEVDFDRFRTMHAVAKATKRELVIEPRRMWMLATLNKCSQLSTPSITKDSTIRRFAPDKKRLSSYEKLLSESEQPLPDYEARGVKPAELRAKPRCFLLATSFGSLSLLQRVKPASGIYLLSASEPFNEESEISFDKLLNWLTLSGLAMYTAHCSGHVDPLGLRQTLEEMQPKTVYPIHTENPELFKRFIEPSGIRIQIPKQSVPFKM
jgi:ribonuclease J